MLDLEMCVPNSIPEVEAGTTHLKLFTKNKSAEPEEGQDKNLQMYANWFLAWVCNNMQQNQEQMTIHE